MSMPDIIELANGQKVKGTFSSHEMQRRLSGLRATMEADSIDAVILTSIHNINYYGDFLYCSFGRQYYHQYRWRSRMAPQLRCKYRLHGLAAR